LLRSLETFIAEFDRLTIGNTSELCSCHGLLFDPGFPTGLVYEQASKQI
jgi:hypothetical protein